MASNNSFLDRFTKEVERKIRPNDLETFWNCEQSFQELVAGGAINQLLNRELRSIAEDPFYLGDWRSKQLIAFRGQSFQLWLSYLDTPRRYIHTLPVHGMYTPVGGDELEYERYRLPGNYRNDVFDPSLKLDRAGSGMVKHGEILRINSKEHAYEFRIARPVLVLRFTSEPFDTLEWLFSKETLQPWQANDSQIEATQLRVASYVLGRLAHQSSLETLEILATHRHHAVRWAAIQALGRLSRTAALQKLEKALSDPHPHLRRAAEKTLRQLTGKTTA